jgi:hypothetical protein
MAGVGRKPGFVVAGFSLLKRPKTDQFVER